MPDPASTTLTAPRLALGDAAADYDDGGRSGARRTSGRPGCSRATSGCGRAIRASARRSPSGSAGSTRRRISSTGSRASRGSGTRSSRRATGRSSWPAWAAAASPRTCSTGRSAAWRATSSLRILDSTDPAYVSATLDDLDPLRTLVIIASKSGTTTEPNAFLAYAWARAEGALDAVPHHRYEGPGAYFAAITDPGRSAEAIEHHDDFREVFINPPDIGGRYSALTYVGLVPASLIGIDLDALLASASAMLGRLPRAGPGDQPGRVARARPRDAGQGRAATS